MKTRTHKMNSFGLLSPISQMDTNCKAFIESHALQDEYKNFSVKQNTLKSRVKNLSHPNNAWRNFVDDSDVVENVCGYLDECYDCLLEETSNRKLFEQMIGPKGSQNWKEFQFLVISELKNSGCFNQLENKDIFDDDFRDSASGCDEVVQDVAFKLMKKMFL